MENLQEVIITLETEQVPTSKRDVGGTVISFLGLSNKHFSPWASVSLNDIAELTYFPLS